jgi:hypothetical protein
MSVGLLLPLAGLALVDSTSIGTLFIPVWLLLTPGPVNGRRILAYLGTIAGLLLRGRAAPGLGWQPARRRAR